jgi:hypothetical protein
MLEYLVVLREAGKAAKKGTLVVVEMGCALML